jgi:Tfp pilus assembly protein PilO
MSLKLLAIPIIVICTLVIAISYVKPDFALLSEKQAQLEQLRSQASSLDAIASNIKSMQTQIATENSDPESGLTDADFLRKVYFPAASDIERGIDQLNFLADQSGVIVSEMQVRDAEKKAVVLTAPEDNMQDSAGLLIAKGPDGAAGEAVTRVHRTYTPDVFTVTIKTAGSYEAMKDFYARVVQAKRFFSLKMVTLAREDQETPIPAGESEKEPSSSSDILFSDMEVDFFLLPTVSLTSAVGDDAFEKARLDFETLAMIRQNRQGVTPELPAANPLGKANPFIK